MPFDHQAIFVRRSLLNYEKFDTSYKIISDYIQLRNLYKQNYRFEYIPSTIAIRDQTQGLTFKKGATLGLKEKARYFERDKSLKFHLTYPYGRIRDFIKNTLFPINLRNKLKEKELWKRHKNKEIKLVELRFNGKIRIEEQKDSKPPTPNH